MRPITPGEGAQDEQPGADAVGQPEWNVIRERHWQELDGFHVV